MTQHIQVLSLQTNTPDTHSLRAAHESILEFAKREMNRRTEQLISSMRRSLVALKDDSFKPLVTFVTAPELYWNIPWSSVKNVQELKQLEMFYRRTIQQHVRQIIRAFPVRHWGRLVILPGTNALLTPSKQNPRRYEALNYVVAGNNFGKRSFWGAPLISMWPKRNTALIDYKGLSAEQAVEKDNELIIFDPETASPELFDGDPPLVFVYQLSETLSVNVYELSTSTAKHQRGCQLLPLFYRAQLHAEKMKTVKPTKTAKHLLVGLVKCGHCGGNFVMANKDGKPHNMRCLTRQRFKDAGCDNSKTVPKVVADYVRTSTSFPFVQEAFQRQQLTTNQKRILAIQSEVTGITSKIADLASAIQTVGAIPEILSQLKERQAERDALNDELAVLERTESPVDFLGSYQIEGDLLESDPVKLNALLRGVGYAIVVKADGTLTVGCDVWRLVEYDRMQAAFIVEHDGVQAAVKQDDQMENIRKRVGWTEAFSVSLRRRNETEKK